ncbi:MAG: hypothetical protein IT349_20615 [Candidatus Eisenbacteria bacterium]|nr:hypothetical protein [Candidatus Eisenbacteria bacterium]
MHSIGDGRLSWPSLSEAESVLDFGASRGSGLIALETQDAIVLRGCNEEASMPLLPEVRYGYARLVPDRPILVVPLSKDRERFNYQFLCLDGRSETFAPSIPITYPYFEWIGDAEGAWFLAGPGQLPASGGYLALLRIQAGE